MSERSDSGARGPRRRAHSRHDAVELVEVHCESWGRFIQLHTKDLSFGGIFVETATPPRIQSDVEVRIGLPENRELKLRARVVHIVPFERTITSGVVPGMGIQFDAMTADQKAQLASLVDLAREREASGTIDREPRTAKLSASISST